MRNGILLLNSPNKSVRMGNPHQIGDTHKDAGGNRRLQAQSIAQLPAVPGDCLLAPSLGFSVTNHSLMPPAEHRLKGVFKNNRIAWD